MGCKRRILLLARHKLGPCFNKGPNSGLKFSTTVICHSNFLHLFTILKLGESCIQMWKQLLRFVWQSIPCKEETVSYKSGSSLELKSVIVKHGSGTLILDPSMCVSQWQLPLPTTVAWMTRTVTVAWTAECVFVTNRQRLTTCHQV